ncbi:MAG: DUF2695 domain-containing protein [Terracidiphilus sp.]|nr:DUF2695 domain-containing protein [Terracidiphilus sp.]MDR3799527.1 DUF2695 domain-containing protein [Terracidiphilus sp.]
MPDKDKKARRKDILHGLRNEERQKTRDGFPASAVALKGLFSFLDEALQTQDCDDTLRLTRDFIVRNVLKGDEMVEWLEDNGGYCDCEVLDNVEQIVSDAVPDYENL